MSTDEQPSREVAHRVFAAEFEDATLSHAESDEERAPNYVVTPTGARINRLFVVGVLTEVAAVSSEQLRARIVDPTGAFVVYAGQYQPDALAALDETDPPEFVAITGKARTFQPEDSDRVYTSIRPESIGTVDATTRDRWTVSTAERTLERVRTAIDAHERAERGDDLREALVADGVPEALAAGFSLAVEHYDTTPTYLGAVGDLALDAARVVAGEREEVTPLDIAPDADGGPERSSTEFYAQADTEPAARAATDSTANRGATATTADSTEATADGTDATADDTTATPGSTGASAESGLDAEANTETSADVAASADEPASAESTTEAAAATMTSDDASSEGDDSTAAFETPTGSEGLDEIETGESGAASSETDGDAEKSTESGSAEATTEDPEDIEEFELDSEERDRIESEFGTEFERGSEVADPGEADIETPEPPDEAASDREDTVENVTAESDARTATEADDSRADTDEQDATESELADLEGGSTDLDQGSADADEPSADTDEQSVDADQPSVDADDRAARQTDEPDADAAIEGHAAERDADDVEDAEDAEDADEADDADDAGDAEGEPGGAIDLEDAVMDAMREHANGDGAEREVIVESVVEEHGVDTDAVEDALQEALLDGRCYEPDDDLFKPI